MSSIGPLRIEIPAAPFVVGGLALSMALSRLLGIMLLDLGTLPRDGFLVSSRSKAALTDDESG